MGKIVYSLVALVCLFAFATAFRPDSSIIPPPRGRPDGLPCFQKKLDQDRNFDLSFICNDGRAYPNEVIEEALYYAKDDWRIYLNLTSTCFQEKANFFMNTHSEKGFYNLNSVCQTKRILVQSVYTQENMVCHVVRPNEQKVYYAKCGGRCNLSYGGVNGFHCIPRGYTHRKFLAYCEYVADYPPTKPLTCMDPTLGEFDPRTMTPTHRMLEHPLADGSMYKPRGYLTEVKVVVPTYCGCRGYFCDNY